MREHTGPVPTWFWIVAGLAVLWEAIGCYTYVTQSLVPDAQRVGGYAQMESWQWGVFAVAVWAGLIGALLLVARSRWAGPLLLVSLLAAALQYGVAAAQGGIDAEARPMAVVVLVVGVALVILASRARRWSWLR